MDKVLLKLWETENELAEIFQTIVVKFAHVNSNYEQVHQPGKCRDFLGDMMWSMYHGKRMRIYGLEYDFSKNPYDTEVTRLSLLFPSKEQQDNFIKNIGYLHEREDKAGLPRSVILDTDQDLTLIIEGDKAWQGCVWKLSLYTFYIKLMSYDDPDKPLSPENAYKVKLTSENEEKMLAHIKSDFNPIEKELHHSHNSSGFVSVLAIYTGKQTKEYYNSVAYEVAQRIFG